MTVKNNYLSHVGIIQCVTPSRAVQRRHEEIAHWLFYLSISTVTLFIVDL